MFDDILSGDRTVAAPIDADKDFGDLHRDEGEEGEREADQPLLPGEVGEVEEALQGRHEHDERDDRDGYGDRTEQIRVVPLFSHENGICV